MQEGDDKLIINLKFWHYQLPSMTIDRNDEYLYREARKYIIERFDHYVKTCPDQDRALYQLMAALDIAVDLKRMQAEAGSMEERLSTLIEEVEKELE